MMLTLDVINCIMLHCTVTWNLGIQLILFLVIILQCQQHILL